jgi:hypothetical protein
MKKVRFRDCSAEKDGERATVYWRESDLHFTPGTKSLARLTAMVSDANNRLSSSYKSIIRKEAPEAYTHRWLKIASILQIGS